MERIIRFKNLCCANCAAKIEKKIQKIKKANDITLSFAAAKILIDAAQEDMDSIIEEIKINAKKIEPEMEFIE